MRGRTLLSPTWSAGYGAQPENFITWLVLQAYLPTFMCMQCLTVLTYKWYLQQYEMRLLQQSRKLSGGRGSGLLPLADNAADSSAADVKSVQ